VIIAATAIGGAGVIVGTLLFGFIGMTLAKFFENPVRNALEESWLWALFFVILAVVGIVVQIMTTRVYEIEPYENRI
jgi:MFS family permease